MGTGRRRWSVVARGHLVAVLLGATAACAHGAADPAVEDGAGGAVAGELATQGADAEALSVPNAPTSARREPDPGPAVSDGRPRRALLSVPRLGLERLVVVPYEGWTDDAPGTSIQDRGRAASPHGRRGGVGPGGVGNYQVTAHRLSSTKAFLDLPALRRGDLVRVTADDTTYVYKIRTTRRTSFRSAASLRQQRAAVPGRPGQRPARAMITLSTCATPEDHAVGNYWSDEFDNPEHRIDKVGVLVRTSSA